MFTLTDLEQLRFAVQFLISNLDDEVDGIAAESCGIPQGHVDLAMDLLKRKVGVRIEQLTLDLQLANMCADMAMIARQRKEKPTP